MEILRNSDIDREVWSALVKASVTGNWFQTPKAYDFYASQPELFQPFAFGVTNDERLRGVCVGYVTVEKNALKQMLTRRAIIIGGPCLADDCVDYEVMELLRAVRKQLADEAIYIECRNFNDYSRWRNAFEAEGFSYVPHLNFHVDCTDKEAMDAKLSENRKRQIKKAVKSGIEIVEVSAAHLESEENIENKIENIENIILDSKPKKNNPESSGDVSQPIAPQSACEQVPRQFDDQSVAANALQDYSEKNTDLQSLQKSQKKKDEEDIAAWYEILAELYRTRVKTPLFPLSFFIEFYRQGFGKYLLVKYEGKVIGGIMCPILEGRCIYEWFVCGMDTEYRNQNPSVMATYAAMEYGNAHGLARFDFMGAGKPNEPYGVREFKARFGGEEVEHGRFLCVTKPVLYKTGTLGVKILKKLK